MLKCQLQRSLACLGIFPQCPGVGQPLSRPLGPSLLRAGRVKDLAPFPCDPTPDLTLGKCPGTPSFPAPTGRVGVNQSVLPETQES